MAVATANPSFVAARRRLFTALFASAGITLDPSLARRRPGRTGSTEDLAPPSAPDSLSLPREDIRWLTRATFGFTIGDDAAYLALGTTDDERWAAWLARQLAPATIDDSGCDGIVANAGYVTLNKTANQLWNDHHSVTNNYYLRMLPVAEVECMTLVRQIYSQRQLFEVMVDFWHDHFSVFGWDYDGGPMFVAMDRDAIRPYALGNFRTMLQAVGESASMMYMLDLYASQSGHPNENYARELMELHTLGAENYAGIIVNPDSPSNLATLGTFTAWDGEIERLKYVDDDVYEAARALTGWTISGSVWPYTEIDNQPLGTFAYDDPNHDQGPKHILTRYFAAYQAEGDGTLLYDMLAQHPGTAHFVAGKMCRRFVGDAPPATLVQSVADVLHDQWQAPDQIAQALQVILQSSEFKTSWATKMKRPAVAAVSALRALAASFVPVPDNTSAWTTTEEFMSRLQAAGHRLFYWPAPNGYPDVMQAWASTGTMGMTLKMLPRLLEMHQGSGYDNAQPFIADVQSQTLAAFPNAADRTAANLMGYWCDRILGYRPEPTHTIALDFFRQNANATDPLDITTDATNDQGQPQHTGTWNLNNLSQHYTIARLRTAIALILCSPDFLRR
jgi:uncharacterized protein (DUF1800 family)